MAMDYNDILKNFQRIYQKDFIEILWDFYKLGYDDGSSEIYEEARQNGYDSGYEKGYDIGLEEGIEEGYHSGLSERD